MQELADKVVVITGASMGIGRALAKECARRGARLVISARSYDKLKDLANELILEYSSTVLAVPADVSVEEDCRQLVEKTIARYGQLDILINNAGIVMRELFENTDPAVLHRLMDVNFWGAVYCTRFALERIVEAHGTIVAINSIAGYRGLPGRTGYSASKFAMMGFFEALRTELLQKDVNVLVACPGFTASNIRVAALNGIGESHGETSMEEGKMMTAEEVAEKVVTAIEKRKRTLVLTATGKLTVLLNKVVPALTDKMVFNHFTKEKNALIRKDGKK